MNTNHLDHKPQSQAKAKTRNSAVNQKVMDDELIDNVVIVDSSKRLSQEEVHCLLANCGEM